MNKNINKGIIGLSNIKISENYVYKPRVNINNQDKSSAWYYEIIDCSSID